MEKILRIEKIEKYYGNKNNITKAVDNISFDVNGGEFVAIMGASGSGKSTLLNCISTIDKVTSGHIYLKDADITKLKGYKLTKFRRDSLGFIFQDFNLLDTLTSFENIALALTIQKSDYKKVDEKVNKVAAALGIKEILSKYPYELSGGQKQRLCIARALLKKPKILILDDSTSAVDTKTDATIRAALQNDIASTTKIIIAQRISSIEASDKIIVLDDGKIDAIGTHDELKVNNAIYREVYESQVKGADDNE